MFQNPQVIIYFLTIFNASRMLIGAISSFYLLTHGLNIIALGFLKALQSLIFLFVDIPTSYLAEKYSRKWAILLAIFLGALWLLLTGLGQSTIIFFLAEILNAFSLTIFSGVFFAYAVDISEDTEQPKLLFHKINQWQFFLMAIAALLGSMLYMLNPRLPWIAAGIICFIIGIVGIYILPQSTVRNKQQKLTPKDLYKIIKHKDRCLWLESLNLALLLGFFQVLLQYWQPLLQVNLGFNLSGMTLGIYFCLILMAQSLFGFMARRLDRSSIFEKSLSYIIVFLPLLISFYLYRNTLIFSIFILIIFGSLQSMIAISRGHYQKALLNKPRAIYESISATFSKIIVLFLLPLIAYMASYFGWAIAISFLSLLAIFNFYLRIKYTPIN